MRDPLSWMPIKYKLTLTMVMICLFGFGVGGYFISDSARRALEEEILLQLQARSIATAHSLDYSLELLGRRTEDFASDGFIRTRLDELITKHTLQRAETEQKNVYRELRRHLMFNKLPLVAAFQDIALFDMKGKKIVGCLDDEFYNTQLYLKHAFEQDSIWYSNFIIEKEEQFFPALAMSAPVWDIQHENKIGYLVSCINFTKWIGSSIFQEGNLLFDTDNSPASFYLSDQNKVGVKVTFSDASTQSDKNSLNQNNNVRLRVLSKDETEKIPFRERSGRYLNYQNKDVLVYSYLIHKKQWIVSMEVDAVQAMMPVVGIQSRFLGTGLIIAIVTAFILFFPIKFLIRPLAHMRDAARKMTDGNLSTRVRIDSADEIGDLAHSFNAMAEATEERTKKLEHTAGLLKKRSNELRLERDLLTTVVHSMNDGLVYLDRFGNIVLYNHAASPLVKIIKSKNIDPGVYLCSKDSKSGKECMHCLSNPQEPTSSCIVDFGEKVFEILATRLTMDGGIQGRILVSRDITERMRIDERQAHQERLAVLGEVAAVMAHELNNPLAAISMFNQMMDTEFPDDSPYREHIAIIKRNTDICKKTIRGLLDYSSATTPEIVEFDIHELLSEVVRFLKPVYEKSNISFEMNFRLAHAHVTSDEIYLRQVFVNLLLNAVQAMDAKGGRVIIETDAFTDKDEIIVDVIDNGPGIPRKNYDKIFEPFFTSKKNGRGTGLGLPTSRRIVEAFGGSLRLIESREGCTLFRVQLPRKAQEGMLIRALGEVDGSTE